MEPENKTALGDLLLAMADDELLLGHRASEWCGNAPILEEDIAFANLALDEIGHALIWYRLLADVAGEDPDTIPDQLVYRRSPAEYRSLPLVELPRGDWAHSMLRQYLFDALEQVRLEHLIDSSYAPLAEAADKIRQEELYHRRHTSAWIRRLGLGTEESHRRLQAALDELWPYALQLCDPLPGAAELEGAGLLPDLTDLRQDWDALVLPLLAECQLRVPAKPRYPHTGRQTFGPHRKLLLDELQSVARLDPQAEW